MSPRLHNSIRCSCLSRNDFCSEHALPSMSLTSRFLLMNISGTNVSEQDFDNNRTQPLLDIDRARTIWKYCPPFFILLGTFGNVFTIVILCRKSMWKLASSPYLVVLSVADITVLYSGLLRQWIIYLKDVDIRLISAALCKLHTTLVYIAMDFSAWILVTVSVERFIYVCFPFKAKSICNRGRAMKTIVVLLLFLFLINCHFLFGFGSVYDQKSGELISHCGELSGNYAAFMANIWPWIDLSVFSMIPFCIIIMCNVCLMTKIGRFCERNKVFPNDGNKVNHRKTSSMTALLMALNGLFLFTTAPISIYLLCYPKSMLNATKDEKARLQLWWAIVNQLMYLNNTINFIFYCVSGSRFRLELKEIFQRRNTMIPTRTLLSNKHAPVKPLVCEPRTPGQLPTAAQAILPEMVIFDPFYSQPRLSIPRKTLQKEK